MYEYICIRYIFLKQWLTCAPGPYTGASTLPLAAWHTGQCSRHTGHTRHSRLFQHFLAGCQAFCYPGHDRPAETMSYFYNNGYQYTLFKRNQYVREMLTLLWQTSEHLLVLFTLSAWICFFYPKNLVYSMYVNVISLSLPNAVRTFGQFSIAVSEEDTLPVLVFALLKVRECRTARCSIAKLLAVARACGMAKNIRNWIVPNWSSGKFKWFYWVIWISELFKYSYKNI